MFGSTRLQIEQNQSEQRRGEAPPPPVHRQAARAQESDMLLPRQTAEAMDMEDDQISNPLWQKSWHLQVQPLPAEDKIKVRQAFPSWDSTRDQYVLPDKHLSDTPRADALCLLKKDRDQKPGNITDFYQQITPYMCTKFYWISYASYATGDLSSLAASVITDPRHGISMYWELIGETDPDKNLEILRSFLGGVVDRGEGGKRYVVTRDGAKGRWTNGPEKSQGNQAGDELAGDELIDAKLLDAAFSCLSAGKMLYRLIHTLQGSLELALSALSAAEAAKCFSAASRALSKVREDPAGEPPIWAALETESAAARSTAMLVQSLNGQPLLYKTISQFVGAMLQKSKDFTEYTDTQHHTRDQQIDGLFNGAAWMVEAINIICSATEDFRKDKIWAGPPPLPGTSGQHKLRRLKFESGTNMIAVSWDKEKRRRVRKAWGVGNEGGRADYDSAVETWLDKRGISPDAAIHAKQIVVMWIRKSGERGGAHFENDTSFRALGEQAQGYVRRGYYVFLAGDEKEGKAARLASDSSLAGHIFNITQFWTDQSDELKQWGGNSRTGQFRLYDYLNRKASSLVHVGAMSGNLEAMALLGHKVEFHAGDPEGPGVMRMQAYAVHDLGLGVRDKLSYNLQSAPYGKPAARFYMDLKLRAKKIYEAICVLKADLPQRIKDMAETAKQERQKRIQQRLTEAKNLLAARTAHLEAGPSPKAQSQAQEPVPQTRQEGDDAILSEIEQLQVQQASANVPLLPLADRSMVQSRENGKYLMAAMVRGVAQGKPRAAFLQELEQGPDCLAKKGWVQKHENLRQATQEYYKYQLTAWRQGVEAIYDRMVNAMDRTVDTVVLLYPNLMTLSPMNEQYGDKQLEQLVDQIMIRAAKKLYEQEKGTQ